MTRYLNKSNIEWCNLTWNPVVGCQKGCQYCYAMALCKRFAKQWGRDPKDPFKPIFYPERLTSPIKENKPSKIFVCSMGELWGKWVPHSWQYLTLEAIKAAHWHTFLNLTKSPEGICWYQYEASNYIRHLPDNLWVGVSVDTVDAVDRLTVLREDVGHTHKFVSFEPLLEDVKAHPEFSLNGIGWVIVGAQTGPGGHQPDRKWLETLCFAAINSGTPLFVKDNIEWPEYWISRPQEFPEGMP